MSTLQLQSEVSIDIKELLGGVSRLDIAEIENLLSEIGVILAQRKSPSLPARESELLQRIGKSVPENTQQRYDELQHKLLADEILPDEHQELLQLVDVVENADAERLQHLLELAQLRRVSLDDLMSQLGVQPPPAYV